MPRASRTFRTATTALLIVAAIFYFSGTFGIIQSKEDLLLSARRQKVEDAFEHAWTGYATHCRGRDSLHPVTDTCDDDFGGWAVTAIDALSTAIIMRKQEIVLDILRSIESIDFGIIKGGNNIQLFEVTIRHFGGMLSAWDLLNGPYKGMVRDKNLMQALYSQMVRLGNVLSCAFDTPSGIPRNWVDPVACVTDDGSSNTVAGAGTLILEFTRLSDITGDQSYARIARRAEEYLISPWPVAGEPYPGLLGSFVSVDDGHFLDSKGSWGSLADCKYEVAPSYCRKY